MMNYPGITGGDPGTVAKIVAAQAHHKKSTATPRI